MYTGWDEIFSGVYCSDVEKIVSSLSRNKGSGLDKIPTRVIKDFVPVIIIIPSIAAIINSSFTTSTCILEVSPILKEGDFEEPGNNRPISLLPILSKVCEKVALRVSEHPILKNKQKSGGGTEQKKVALYWNFSYHLYGHYTWGSWQEKANSYIVYLYMSDAFNSINHNIFCKN